MGESRVRLLQCEKIERGEAVLLHEFSELKNDLYRTLNNVLARN